MELEIKLTTLTDKQRSIADDIIHSDDVKNFIIKAGRQAGKSYLVERLAFIFSLSNKDLEIAFIMANESQNRSRFRSMVKWIPKRLIKKKPNSSGNRYIEFANGTRLTFFTAGNPDGIASNSFDYVICDERGLYPKGAWEIIKPTTSAKPKAKIVSVSTPRGKNAFYNDYMMGINPEFKRYRSYSMSYTDNPYYDLEDVEEARKSFPDELFRQEYLAEFIEGISSVFGDFNKYQKIKKFKDIIPGNEYYYGLDISDCGDDDTILTVIDDKGEPVLIYETISSTHPKQARELAPIIKGLGKRAQGYGEKNGLGNSLCDILIEDNIDITKWTTTNDSKQKLVAQLNLDLADNKTKLPTSKLCPKLDEQMSEYMGIRTKTNKINYCHPAGGHDDYVDSFMLANMARKKLIPSSTGMICFDY